MPEMSIDLSNITSDGNYGLTIQEYDACAKKAKLNDDYVIDMSKFKMEGIRTGKIWLLVSMNEGRGKLTFTTPDVYSVSSIKQKDKRLNKSPSQGYLNLKASKHYGR